MDAALRRRLRRSTRQINTLQAKRVGLIVEARLGGATLREIAEHVGMTHVGVQKLLARQPVDAAP